MAPAINNNGASERMGSAAITPVPAVPTLAPRITPTACSNVIIPLSTRLTVITVTAVEDCTNAVITVPVNAPIQGLAVNLCRLFSMAGPASSSR